MKAHTPERKQEIVIAICEKVANDEGTINSICEIEGVSYQTFYNWIGELEELEMLYKESQEKSKQTVNKRIVQKVRGKLERWVDEGRVKNRRRIYSIPEPTTGINEAGDPVIIKHAPVLTGLVIDTEEIPTNALTFLAERLDTDFAPKPKENANNGVTINVLHPDHADYADPNPQ